MSSVRFARPFLEQVLWWQTFRGLRAAATEQIARVRGERGIVRRARRRIQQGEAGLGSLLTKADSTRGTARLWCESCYEVRASSKPSRAYCVCTGCSACNPSENNPAELAHQHTSKLDSRKRCSAARPEAAPARQTKPPCPSTTAASTRSARNHRCRRCPRPKNRL